MRSAITLGLGLLIGAAAPGLRAGQTAQQASQPPAKPATQAPAKPATQASVKPVPQTSAKPAALAPAKPATQAPAKPATQTPAKPVLQTSAKPAALAPAKPGPAVTAKPTAPAAKPVSPAVAKPAVKASKKPAVRNAEAKSVEKPAAPEGARQEAAESEVKAARRDPFESLVSHGTGKAAPNLPPGKAGLQVSTLRLDGIVHGPNGMIAVVSNPQSRTYFLREGDHLYDGSVDKITMDGVSFHEEGKDAFGKPVERQVNKRIYSTSSGEQQ